MNDYVKIARSFRLPQAVSDRREMLQEINIAPLTTYVAELRHKHPTWEFPDFDPCDGGIKADMLFLMEKPGPMTSEKGKGSGFVSRNNDDLTADAVFNFMQKAGIPRHQTLLWNLIPGWNGTRKITAIERKAAMLELPNLMALLPQLKTIVLVGREASKAAKYMSSVDIQIFTSAHPSPIVRATNPAMWKDIPRQWARAFDATSSCQSIYPT